MASTISKRRLRRDTSRILRQLSGGRDFLVTRDGVVIGRLVSVAANPRLDVEVLRTLRRVTADPGLIDLRSDEPAAGQGSAEVGQGSAEVGQGSAEEARNHEAGDQLAELPAAAQ